MGACSREEPQPKFFPATMMSPACILRGKLLSASSITWRASSSGSDVLRYLAGIIASVSISSPNLQTLPLNSIANLPNDCFPETYCNKLNAAISLILYSECQTIFYEKSNNPARPYRRREDSNIPPPCKSPALGNHQRRFDADL